MKMFLIIFGMTILICSCSKDPVAPSTTYQAMYRITADPDVDYLMISWSDTTSWTYSHEFAVYMQNGVWQYGPFAVPEGRYFQIWVDLSDPALNSNLSRDKISKDYELFRAEVIINGQTLDSRANNDTLPYGGLTLFTQLTESD